MKCLSMKYTIYDMSCLQNVRSMKCPTMILLSMKYKCSSMKCLVYKCPVYEMSYDLVIYDFVIYEMLFYEMTQHTNDHII